MSEIAGSSPALAFKYQRNKRFLARSLDSILWGASVTDSRGNVLGLRTPGLEYPILCQEGSVISFISPSSAGSAGPV